MMKKMWKNRSGVSPVIATILMVAITVVLAAVLYVMVMGFGSPANQTPTGSLTSTKTGTGAYTVSVASISKSDVKLADTKVVITPTATGVTVYGLNSTTSVANILAGDYAQITGLTVAGTYTVSLLYVPSGNAIASTTIVVA